MEDKIRTALAQFGRMGIDPSGLDREADLYANGLTSNASVNVMLALEDEFDIEFPDADLKKATFGSIANIEAVLTKLTA
jgi:acyl carrier protein